MAGVNIFDTGIDVGKIVDNLMLYQSQKLFRLQDTEQLDNVQLSAYGSLQNLITSFSTSLTNISAAFATIAYQVASSNSGVATAAVTSNDIGVVTHQINVTQLAASQVYTGQTQFSSKINNLNISETLTFTNNSNPSDTFNVQINPDDALVDIMNNINNAPNNNDVTASIITSNNNGVVTYNLVLTSNTGAASAFTVSGDTAINFQQTATAADAQFTFDGLQQSSSTNIIDSIVDGLTITLTGVSSSGSDMTTLTTSLNNTQQLTNVQNAINSMIAAYNQVITFLDADQHVSYYDSNNKILLTANNDSFSVIKGMLQSVMSAAVSTTGDISTLTDAGIIMAPSTKVKDQYDALGNTYASWGSLMISATPMPNLDNSTPFNWALNNDFQSLQTFFTGDNGFIANVTNQINNNILSGSGQGIIANSENAINNMLSFTDQEIFDEQTRLMTVKTSLTDKYARLNAVMMKLKGLGEYLDKEYSFLNSLYKGD